MLCSQTCEYCRSVCALVLPNKVAHVTGGVTGSEQAPHIDRVKLGNRHNTRSDTIYLSSYHCVCTLSSWALETLSVRPPILLSPPYTLSPGISFSRASFPRAWSLRGQFGVNLAEIHALILFCFKELSPVVVRGQDSCQRQAFPLHYL